MTRRPIYASICGLILLFAFQGQSWAADKKTEVKQLSILGWVESAYLEPWGFKFRVRLDTGAKTSSISARDIIQFQKDGDDWVRFIFDFKEDKGESDRSVVIERPVHRFLKIKRHNDKIQMRPVVMLDICINGETQTSQFSLIDRRGLNYPMLLGRRLLKEIALVDSGKSFIGSRACAKKLEDKAKKPKKSKD